MLPEISFRKSAPVKQIQQHFLIFRIHPVSFASIPQIPVHVFAVDADYAGGIAGTLHPSLDLQRIDAGFQKLRQQIQGAQVFQAHDAPVVPVQFPAAGYLRRAPDLIRQTAGLGAPPPVAASSADKTAEQALAGIAVTERSVDKAFDFYVQFLPDPPDLLQGKFSGRHHPGGSPFFGDPGPPDPGYGHLGTGVHRQVRKIPAHLPRHARVLNDHRVQPLPVIRLQIRDQRVHFPLLDQGVDGHIQGNAPQMGIIDGLQHPFFRQVVRISPGPEPAAADVDRVRAGTDGRLHAFIRAGRRQNLHFSLSHR